MVLRSPLGDMAHEATLQELVDAFVNALVGGEFPSALRYTTRPGRKAYAGRRVSDHTILPESGNRIRVVWAQVIPATIEDPTGNYVELKFGTKPPFYAGEVFSHWESFEGDVDEPIVINLANGEPVDVNIHYEEF